MKLSLTRSITKRPNLAKLLGNKGQLLTAAPYFEEIESFYCINIARLSAKNGNDLKTPLKSLLRI
jgi:hypothetical protein